MKKKKLSKNLECIKTMPLLRHRTQDEYDVMRSSVCEWIVEQPGVRQWLFDQANERGLIVFDKERGAWRGVEQ